MRYLIPFFCLVACQQPRMGLSFTQQVEDILKRVSPPTFNSGIFTVKITKDFQAEINKTIIRCHEAGGGMVLIEKGNHLCDGPINLLSNVNLHLAKGAIISFGVNPTKYLPTVKVRWEGTVCNNYSPLIYAYRQKNIAITGQGELNGQADKFWFAWKKQSNGDDQEKAKKILRKMGEIETPEDERNFGDGYKLRPTLVEFYECENILLDGFTASQSPFWTIYPVFSKNITVRNLNILHGTTNDDGIDPDSCEDVLIENCKINTDDDPISIKAGRDQDAWKRPQSRNIVVRNCTMTSKVGNGFCIGSEMSGGVENIFANNCEIPAADHGINIKANLDRGGFVRNIFIRNILIETCNKAGIRIQMDYHSYRGGNFPPDFDGIYFEEVSVKNARDYGLWAVGVPTKFIGKVTLKNVTFLKTGKGNETKFVDLIN